MTGPATGSLTGPRTGALTGHPPEPRAGQPIERPPPQGGPSYRAPDDAPPRETTRKWIEIASCLPLLGVVLLASPLVDILARPVSDPLGLFAIWAALIAGAWLHGRLRPSQAREMKDRQPEE